MQSGYSPHVLGVQTVRRRNDLSPSVGGVVPGLAVVRWKGYNRSSRKSQPPLGDLAVKGAVRQRGTSVYRGAWSTPPVLGTGNRWFESSYADENKQEERFDFGL